MAIQIQFESDTGTVYPLAYARISKTIIENPRRAPKNVSIEVVIHGTREAKQAGKTPVWGPHAYQVQKPSVADPEVMECAVNPDVVRLTELYAWLKSQPSFSGGVDV